MASVETIGSALLRASHGKTSIARGLAATARFFNDSTESIGCPIAVVMFRDNAVAVTASRYNILFVFIVSFSFGGFGPPGLD
jgi:hypothetical protein